MKPLTYRYNKTKDKGTVTLIGAEELDNRVIPVSNLLSKYGFEWASHCTYTDCVWPDVNVFDTVEEALDDMASFTDLNIYVYRDRVTKYQVFFGESGPAKASSSLWVALEKAHKAWASAGRVIGDVPFETALQGVLDKVNNLKGKR